MEFLEFHNGTGVVMSRWALRGVVGGLTIGLVGCMTPAKERQIHDDIFALQARMMELENQSQTQGKSMQSNGENANQRIASTSTRIEKTEADLLHIKGEMEALRIGVTTGLMPGANLDQDGSVAKSLKDLNSRLTAVEEAQKQIMTAIEKATGASLSTPRKGDAAESNEAKEPVEKAGKTKANFVDLKKNFDGKKYKLVIDDAPTVLEASKKKAQKEDVIFMYAESLFNTGKLREAALKYNDLIDMKPSAKRVTLAKLRMGDCFRHLGDKAAAKLYYEDLVTSHPSSAEAKKAKDMLSKL